MCPDHIDVCFDYAKITSASEESCDVEQILNAEVD